MLLELDEELEFLLVKVCVEVMGLVGEGFVVVRGMENYVRLCE